MIGGLPNNGKKSAGIAVNGLKAAIGETYRFPQTPSLWLQSRKCFNSNDFVGCGA